jgi:anti-sigma B factor antagonist
MTVESPAEGTVRVALSGELDLQRAYTFDEELRRLESQSPALIILDLRDLAFMDSSGLGRILACHRRARRAGRHVRIVRDSGPVQRVLSLAALDEVLDTTSDASAITAP